MSSPITKYIFVFTLAFGLMADSAWSRPREKRFSVVSNFTDFSDLKVTDNSEEVELESSMGVELGVRIYGPFNFLASGSRSVDGLRSDFGFGFRVNLPGFLFIGANKKDLRVNRKLYPVNTSLFLKSSFSNIEDEMTAEETNAVSIEYGLNIDIFLFQQFTYLTTLVGFYNFQGNTFISLGAGVGFDF